MEMVPAHLRLEIGHIWYSPLVQRTKVTTETAYLMMSEAFDRLGESPYLWVGNGLMNAS